MALLKAAEEFRKRPEGQVLADQLSEMGLKMARGVVRHGYDTQKAEFYNITALDGKLGSSGFPWAFQTQQEKDEAIKLDPRMRQVPVVGGASFYQGPYFRDVTGTRIPQEMAMAAWLTKDPELLERVKLLAEQIMRESPEATSAFNPEGKWTFYANGLYIKMMVLLYQTTDDQRYLQWARTLADREIDHLDKIAYPQWWRVRERGAFLEGLLRLYVALEGDEG